MVRNPQQKCDSFALKQLSVFTLVIILRNVTFYVFTLYCLVNGYQHFSETYGLHFQCRNWRYSFFWNVGSTYRLTRWHSPTTVTAV